MAAGIEDVLRDSVDGFLAVKQAGNSIAASAMSQASGRMGIGITTPQISSILDLTSTDKGLLLPRISNPTATVATPAAGHIAYNSALNQFEGYDGTSWSQLGGGANTIYSANDSLAGNRIVSQGANTLAFTASAVNAFSVDGTTLSVDASNGRVGILTTAPTHSCHINGDTLIGGSFVLNLRDATTVSRFVVHIKDNASQGAFLRIENTNVGTSNASAGIDLIYSSTGLRGLIRAMGDNSTADATTSRLAMELGGNNIVGSGISFIASGSNQDFRFYQGGFAVANEIIRFDTSGNSGFGTIAPSARIEIKGSGATSSTFGFKVQNATGTNNGFVVRDDGNVGVNIANPSVALEVVGLTQSTTYTSTAKAIATATATQDIDFDLGDAQSYTIDTATTFTFSNFPVTNRFFGFTLRLTKDATGTARALIWPASVKWQGGIAPADLLTSAQITTLHFYTIDAGTTVTGVQTVVSES